jgi:hypothetical protein
MSDVLPRLQHGARTILAGYPSVYMPYAKRVHLGGPGKIVADDTQILIDGYTRSASTFAVLAFQFAQPQPVRVARHLHASAGIVVAARRGLPILLCIRPPEPTVLSAVVREPHITLTGALWSYARFYEVVLPYKEQCLVARFEEVTTDFGAVIDRLNLKFGSSFARFDHSRTNVEKVFELIEQRSRRPSWAGALADYQSGLIGTAELERAINGHRGNGHEGRSLEEKWVARPSADRQALKSALVARYSSPAYERRRRRAERAYEAIAG